jgi:putative transposase
MSKKRTKYTSTFKTKLVLELLQNESTLVQIASKHNILPSVIISPSTVFTPAPFSVTMSLILPAEMLLKCEASILNSSLLKKVQG